MNAVACDAYIQGLRRGTKRERAAAKDMRERANVVPL